MTIAMTEAVLGVWFVNLTEDSDWMLALTDAGDTWLMEYRFRYYCDDSGDPNAPDEKNWYTASLPKKEANLEKVVGKNSLIYQSLIDMAGSTEGNYELLRGDKSYEDFLEEFMELPFVHATKMEEKNLPPSLRTH